jgi:hypothetical protein
MRPHDESSAEARDDELTRIYRRTCTATAPAALDRDILAAARRVHARSQYLAPLALAASVLLSLAVVLAIAFGPRAAGPRGARHAEESVRVMQAAQRGAVGPIGGRRLYTSDPPGAHSATADADRQRDPHRWLAEIAALRKAGRRAEADAQFRRFQRVYPGFGIEAGASTDP